MKRFYKSARTTFIEQIQKECPSLTRLEPLSLTRGTTGASLIGETENSNIFQWLNVAQEPFPLCWKRTGPLSLAGWRILTFLIGYRKNNSLSRQQDGGQEPLSLGGWREWSLLIGWREDRNLFHWLNDGQDSSWYSVYNVIQNLCLLISTNSSCKFNFPSLSQNRRWKIRDLSLDQFVIKDKSATSNQRECHLPLSPPHV